MVAPKGYRGLTTEKVTGIAPKGYRGLTTEKVRAVDLATEVHQPKEKQRHMRINSTCTNCRSNLDVPRFCTTNLHKYKISNSTPKISKLGTLDFYTKALKWWLGIDLAQGLCCNFCPSLTLDPLGHHAITCKHGGDVVPATIKSVTCLWSVVAFPVTPLSSSSTYYIFTAAAPCIFTAAAPCIFTAAAPCIFTAAAPCIFTAAAPCIFTAAAPFTLIAPTQPSLETSLPSASHPTSSGAFIRKTCLVVGCPAQVAPSMWHNHMSL
eukprot:Em0015g883a